jgi:proteasome lid subunit RPN8/RPN11
MKMRERMRRWLTRLFDLDRFEFEKVIIDREVIDNIVELARQTLPKEFISFLEGSISKKVLRVHGLFYQEYIANPSYTVYKFNPPMASNIVGSVHSHPGASNRPSRADLRSFSKNGMVHLIIRMPYRQENIRAYDKVGNPIGFEVAD